MVNVKGFTSKITQNADKIGVLLGVTVGTGGGINDLMGVIDQIMQGNIHPPDLAAMLGNIQAQGYVKTGIMAAVGGMILQELNLPMISKYGKPLQNFGIGYAAGSTLIQLLHYSTHADEGCNTMINKMYQNNVASANQSAYSY